MVCSQSSHSSHSRTSTEYYGHEPFETYASKVRDLLVQSFPGCSPTTPVWRMAGGSNHRVTGAVLPQGMSVVIRSPRFDNLSWFGVAPVDEAAVISYLERTTSIPLPSIFKYDWTESNILEAPYTIQRMVPGQALIDVYPSMSYTEKCSIVNGVAQLIASIHNVPFSSIGVLKASHDFPNVSVCPFARPPAPPPAPPTVSPARPTVDLHSFLTSQTDYQLRRWSHKPGIGHMYRVLSNVLQKLLADIKPSGLHIVLYHPDFAARNVMVDRDSLTGQWVVTGMLDWEDAAAVPAEIAYESPFFLWNWDADEDSETEPEPVGDEGHKLRHLFRQQVSRLLPDYLGILDSCRDLRELAWYAIRGIHSSYEQDRAGRFLERHGFSFKR